jgi:hypothetical protein
MHENKTTEESNSRRKKDKVLIGVVAVVVAILGIAQVSTKKPESNNWTEPSVTKRLFQHEVFTSSWDAGNKIKLISESECEMESNGRVFSASYSHEGKQMRFVYTAFGSQMIGYADVYSNGIVMSNAGIYKKGELLLNAEGMRMKEEADRKAEAEQQRINLEAPKILIGLWKQVQDPPGNEEMEGVMFNADGTWASVNWQRKEATAKGHWHVKDGELNKGLFNVGTFREGKIVELTQDRFVYERNTQKFIATRVVDGADGKKEEAGVPASQNQPAAELAELGPIISQGLTMDNYIYISDGDITIMAEHTPALTESENQKRKKPFDYIHTLKHFEQVGVITCEEIKQPESSLNLEKSPDKLFRVKLTELADGLDDKNHPNKKNIENGVRCIRLGKRTVTGITRNVPYEHPDLPKTEDYRYVLGIYHFFPTELGAKLYQNSNGQPLESDYKFRALIKFDSLKKSWSFVKSDWGYIGQEKWESSELK